MNGMPAGVGNASIGKNQGVGGNLGVGMVHLGIQILQWTLLKSIQRNLGIGTIYLKTNSLLKIPEWKRKKATCY